MKRWQGWAASAAAGAAVVSMVSSTAAANPVAVQVKHSYAQESGVVRELPPKGSLRGMLRMEDQEPAALCPTHGEAVRKEGVTVEEMGKVCRSVPLGSGQPTL